MFTHPLSARGAVTPLPHRSPQGHTHTPTATQRHEKTKLARKPNPPAINKIKALAHIIRVMITTPSNHVTGVNGGKGSADLLQALPTRDSQKLTDLVIGEKVALGALLDL
jgi:hypothetical protein